MENLLLNTAYFAPIPYFTAINRAQRRFIEQFENFGKQSYRNRCEIMTANGVISLPVPVAKANSKTLVKDLRIIYDTPWQKLHFRSIESAYKNSPYYDYYIDDLMPFFEKKETYLLDLNNAILEIMLGLLKINRPFQMTDDYIPENTPGYTDLRNTIHPKPSRRKPGGDFPVQPYRQTFADRFPFTPALSILDLLFCCGPEAKNHL
ncbi:MAG: WbqC family protein [Odoribacter sp.]|nr:WbqC family protein [Odoribacter sp.]